MTSPSKTVSAKIRDAIAKHPDYTPKKIAEVVGCKVNLVYQTKYLLNKNVPKKPRKIRISTTEAKLAKRLKVPVTEYAKNLAGFDPRSDIIAELRHQIVGFRAVISYLENQLGLKNSQ